MSSEQLRNLHSLLISDDWDTCMQGVELAKSLGDDVVFRFLDGTRVAWTVPLRAREAPMQGVHVEYPTSYASVVPPFVIDGRHGARVALALAAGCTRIPDALRSMEELELSGGLGERDRMEIDLGVLRDYPLRSLRLNDATTLKHTGVLSTLPLETLIVSRVESYDLSDVELDRLRCLVLQAVPFRSGGGERRAPKALPELRTLVLRSNPQLVDLAWASHMTRLRELIATTAIHVVDVQPLADLPLKKLALSKAERLLDVSSLPTTLEELSLMGASKLVELESLRRLKRLRRLDLSYTGVRDYRPLLELPALEELWVRQTKIATTLPAELESKVEAWRASSASDRA